MVKTNCYQVTYNTPTSGAVWYQYMIEIIPKKHVREKEMTDGVLPPIKSLDDAHPERVERFKQAMQTQGSNPLSRRILSQLTEDLLREGKQILAVRIYSAQ
jgi:hypothetical protein